MMTARRPGINFLFFIFSKHITQIGWFEGAPIYICANIATVNKAEMAE